MFDDKQPLDEATQLFLCAFADALERMRIEVRAETRETARPKNDRAEVAPTNEALYKLGLKQFLARPEEALRAPKATRTNNKIVGAADPSLKDSLKASLSRARSSFELSKMRGR
jgi:hypothetical protein